MTMSKFVIMKHQAKKAGLHFDLRFKMPKSKDWESFSVRKGVPTLPGKKVLAVKTTIHSEKEALLTGKIESGYGAGTLTKWDGGSCDIIVYKDKHIKIDFKGSKIKGVYHLINTSVADKDAHGKSYFLFKGNSLNEKMSIWNKPAYDNELGKSSDAKGLISKLFTGDVELDEDQADLQQTKPLKWSVTKPVRNVVDESISKLENIINFILKR